MFATKILIASALAAGSLAFAAKPADAATHVSVGIGYAAPVTYYAPAPAYYTPAPTYYTTPTYYTPTYVAPTYCPAPVVYDRDDYRHPDFFLRFNFGDRFHHEFRHDRR